MIVKLKRVLIAFPDLFEAKAFAGGGEAKFKAAFLIDKGDPQLKKIQDAINAVGTEKWGEKWPEVRKVLVNDRKMCLGDGEHKSQYEGYEGRMFLNASNKSRPDVRAADKTPLVREDGLLLNGGALVNAGISLWAQDSRQYGKRINAELKGVQYLCDQEQWGGGVSLGDDFFDDESETVAGAASEPDEDDWAA